MREYELFILTCATILGGASKKAPIFASCLYVRRKIGQGAQVSL